MSRIASTSGWPGPVTLVLVITCCHAAVGQEPAVTAEVVTAELKNPLGVRFSPDGKYLTATCRENVLRLWDPATGREVKVLEGSEKYINSFAFSPDSKSLAATSHDGSLRVWDITTGRVRLLSAPGAGEWSRVAYSPDGKLLATGVREARAGVTLWNLATEKKVTYLGREGDEVSSFVFTADGKQLVGYDYGNRILVWDVNTGKQVREARWIGRGPVFPFELSPDGRVMVTASWDFRVRLVDFAKMEEIETLATGDDDNRCVCVAFSPDGRTVAAADVPNGFFCIWDAVTGKLQHSVQAAEKGIIISLAYSPDGRTLATCWRGGIKLWKLPEASKRISP